ncbi:MAG: right-handed parallel beta-helix repeat-containing protein, partial [Acidobacteriota bacterium]
MTSFRSMAFLIVSSLLVSTAAADVFVVDSVSDAADADERDGLCDVGSGACTLRAALEEANRRPGPDTVLFALDPGGGFIIRPGSELPTIDDPVTIDGTSQPGHAGTPLIELDGSAATGFPHGFRITGGNTRLESLSIHSFRNSSIRLSSRGGNEVVGCLIGARPNGSTPGSGLNGIYVFESPGNRIIDNLIANSTSHGVHVSGLGSGGTIVQGNVLGLADDGVTPAGNGLRGISIVDAPDCVIGGPDDGEGNVVMASGTEGIAIVEAGSGGAVVTGNRVGGGGTLRNFVGLFVNGASDCRIGGDTLGAANVVSGNFT